MLEWLTSVYQSDMISDNMIGFVVEGERKMFESQRFKKLDSADQAETHWLYTTVPGIATVEKHFDNWFRSPISMIFFQVGKDHYSKFTKVTLFVLLVLIPGFLLVMLGGTNKMLDLVDPMPEEDYKAPPVELQPSQLFYPK